MSGEPHVPSYYTATANPSPEHPVFEGETRADVCVVGAGYTGLTTALELSQRGFKVIVLEAARVGWGASGRNGGQICTGYSASMSGVEKWVGADDALALWRLAEEAKAIIRDRVRRHGIACDLKPGYLYAAPKRRDLEDLRRQQAHLSEDYGYAEARIVEHDEIAAMLETKLYRGGLVDDGGGHLHPLNYCLGLADAALAAGVTIFEGSKVVRVETGARPCVHTARGRVDCDFVALCGNAYLGDLVPSIRARIMPVATYMSATSPMEPERARRLIRDDVAVADTNFVLNYFRLSADHRLLFGGRVSYTAVPPPNLKAAMRRSMLKVYPQLGDVALDYAWGGNVAITVERTPHLGRASENVYFAHGFSGQGVALTGIAGRCLAEAIAGQAERFDLFSRLPHSIFPGGMLMRTPILALAMLWFRLRDLI